MGTRMLAQFYSTELLDRKLRTTFELPTDPYDKDKEVAQKAFEYLKAFSIFFYRDVENSNGVVIDLEDGNPESFFDRKGFIGYKHLVDLDMNTFVVLPWRKSTPEKISQEGDDRAWLHFNEERFIHTVSSSQVWTT
jgi:hypothetical protein